MARDYIRLQGYGVVILNLNLFALKQETLDANTFYYHRYNKGKSPVFVPLGPYHLVDMTKPNEIVDDDWKVSMVVKENPICTNTRYEILQKIRTDDNEFDYLMLHKPEDDFLVGDVVFDMSL